MIADISQRLPVVLLDVRGWLSPRAAWEAGVDSRNLVVIRCSDRRLWPQVAAAVCEGVTGLYAEVPSGVKDQDLRRLTALIRARQVRAVMRPVRGDLPTGVAHLRMRAVGISWEGAIAGHGKLDRRTLIMEVSGKGAAGITRRVELEDDGENTLRVVSRMAAPAQGRAG
jgi:hypothetical protein